MKQQKKSRGYVISENPITGKRRKEKIDEEMEDFMSDEGLINKPFPQATKILPCPYKFDDSEIAEKLIKPFKIAKFTCEVDVEISLAVSTQVPNEEHIHKVIFDVDESRFPPGADLSEYELDFASLFCGLFYAIKPQVKVKLTGKEINEDKEIQKLIKKVSDEAIKGNKELEELGEKEANEQRLKNHSNLFNRINEYFQEHLTESIKRVVERLEFEAHLLNDRADERESGITIMLEEEEKELRKRLPTAKGRVPIKQRSDFNILKQDFIYECKKILEELESKKAKLNKNQLAKKMFRGDNPLLLLNRKLKGFDLTFDEILQEYIEQKSP